MNRENCTTALVVLFGVVSVLALDLQAATGANKTGGNNNVTLLVEDVVKAEGHARTIDFTFTVRLSRKAPAGGTQVQWDTVDGGATVADNDYDRHKGTLQFAEGETQHNVVVKVHGDSWREDDETFRVRFWFAKQGKGDKNEKIVAATGTIKNDDDEYRMTIEDVTDYESHLLTTTFSFLVTCNARVRWDEQTKTINLKWRTVAVGSATEGEDYEPAAGTLTFRPGERYKAIEVVVKNDNRYEPDETFKVELTLPQRVRGDTLSAIGTIKSDVSDDTPAAELGNFAGHFVSPTNGIDGDGRGTMAKPFKTLAYGLSKQSPGETLYLREGEYFAQGLDISSLQGTAAKPIHIRAFPGERIVIKMTKSLGTDGWEPVTKDDPAYRQFFSRTVGPNAIGKIYKKDTNLDISRLYVNGQEVGVARWPDAPVWSELFWNRWQSRRPVGDGQTREKIVDGANPSAEPDTTGWRIKRLKDLPVSLNGAMVAGNLGGFVSRRARITAHLPGNDFFDHEPPTRKTRITRKTGAQHDRTIRYYVYGIPLLDAEQEWGFYKKPHLAGRPGGTVYVWLKNSINPSSMERIEGRVEGPRYTLVSNKDKGPSPKYVTIDGVHFFGGAVNLPRAEHVTIRNSTITYFTNMNLMKSRHCVLANNEIRYGDGGGINMEGNLRALVENNLIEHTAPVEGSSVACDDGSLLPVIRGNTVRYSGSSVTIGVSTAGVEEYESIVEHNYVEKVGLYAWDGAAIQRTNQGAANTIIRHNWFFETYRGAMRLDAGPYPILYAKIYRNVNYDCHKGFGLNGEYLDVFHHTGLESRSWEHRERDPYWDINNPHEDLNLRIDNAPMRRMNRFTLVRNNATDGIKPSHDTRDGVARNREPNWQGLDEGVPLRGQIRDPENHDFRPWSPGSILIDAGVPLKEQGLRWASRLEGMARDEIKVNVSERRSFEDGAADYAGSAPDLGAYESESRFYSIPGHRGKTASHPIPFDGAHNVRDDVNLMFRPASQATEYDVYIGTDENEIRGATDSSQTRLKTLSPDQNILVPASPAPNTTYYWRVDTVLDRKTRKIVKGPAWSFTTGDLKPVFRLERSVYKVIEQGTTDDFGKAVSAKANTPVSVRYLIRNNGTGALELVRPPTVAAKTKCSARLATTPKSLRIPPGAVVFFDVILMPQAKGAFSGAINVEWRPLGDDTKQQNHNIEFTGKAN